VEGVARAELTALAWSPVLGPVAVGLGLLSLTAGGVLGGPEPGLLWLALGALGSGAATCLDDPAAGFTASSPAGLRRRTAPRLLVPVLVAGAWCLAAAGLDGTHGLSGASLALTGTGLVAGLVAVASLLRRLGRSEPGPGVGSAALLGVVTCLLFQPFGDVQVLQAYADRGAAPGLWPVVIAVALGSLALTTRDAGA
jgi:hypothetical protein